MQLELATSSNNSAPLAFPCDNKPVEVSAVEPHAAAKETEHWQRRFKEASRLAGLSSADRQVFIRVASWRLREARQRGCAAYHVLTNQTILSLIDLKPLTLADLAEVEGLGKERSSRYGEALLSLMNPITTSPETPRNGLV